MKILVIISIGVFSYFNSFSQIRFLSDSDIVYHMLEDYQSSVYESDPHAFRWKNSPEQIKLFDSIAKIYLPTLQADSITREMSTMKLTTRYEDPNAYWILSGVIKIIELQLKKDSIKYINPRIGTLPTTTLNAFTNRSFPDSPLIVVNSGIFGFSHELIKIAFKTTGFHINDSTISFTYGKKELAQIIADNFNLIPRFSMALEDYANNRRIKGQAPPDTIQAKLGMQLVTCMEFFTIAHEYGHMILRHTPIGKLEPELKLANSNKNLSFDLILNSWQQEIEADLFGTFLLDSYIKSHSDLFDGILQYAPYIFFQLAEIAEESAYILKNKALPDSLADLSKKELVKIVTELAKKAVPSFNRSFTQHTFQLKSTFSDKVDTTTMISKSHPPNWARAQLIKNIIEQNNITDEHVFDSLGVAFVDNLQTLWDIIKVPWLKISTNDTADLGNVLQLKIQSLNQEADLGDVTKRRKLNNNTTSSLENSFWHFMDSVKRIDEPVKCDSLKSLGFSLFEKKAYRKSIEALKKAEMCGLKSSKFYFILGSDYLDIYDNINAIKYYSLAISKEMPDVYYWNYGNRAIAYRRLGKDSLSLNDFEKAFQMTNNPDGQIYRERAVLYLQMKQYDSSIKDYVKALEIESNNISYLTELYEAYAMRGDYQKVVDQRKHFLSHSPSNEYLLIFDFFELVSRLQLSLNTASIDKEISLLLKKKYDFIWYFDNFNKSINAKKLNLAISKKIMNVENKIKLQLSTDTEQ